MYVGDPQSPESIPNQLDENLTFYVSISLHACSPFLFSIGKIIICCTQAKFDFTKKQTCKQANKQTIFRDLIQKIISPRLLTLVGPNSQSLECLFKFCDLVKICRPFLMYQLNNCGTNP